ncbi:MAG: UvrD-helicase domain-containing protein [Bacteroidales bacterium]|nr:UvrD-helicase domain-containing protein [Bacteroidales bacterium]
MKNDGNISIEGLNTAQNEAVRHTEGASIIIAGAGSGKTKVLTHRIANILEQGCPPSKVLALTFTKKAANEMKERIALIVGADKAKWIWMGTFHSIFVRFLRGNAQLLGYPDQFTIYDQSDSRSAIRLCIKELDLDDKTYKANDILSRISMAKNNLVSAEAYRNNPTLIENDMAARKGRICDIYSLYAKKCKTAGAMDFDDILLNTNILFRDHQSSLEIIRDQFRYIMVDEYQDTNYSQYLILKKLSEKHRNICVVGDDSQSIYGFRGARIENILNFKKDYPEAQEFRLEQNYRSTQTIVNAANSLISKNTNRLKKECFSKASVGDKITIIKAFTEQEEGYLIASSIVEKIYTDKTSYDNFVVLYRTNAQSRAIEESLRKRNLPYKVYAGYSFYDRAEVKDMLSYFRILVNPQDDEAFRRVINFPARGIGDTSMGYLTDAARKNGLSLYESLSLDDVILTETGLKPAALSKMRTFATMINEVSNKATTTDAYELALEIGNVSGSLILLKNDTSLEGQAKMENVEELFNSIKDYVEEEKEMRKELSEEEYGPDTIVTLGEYLENIVLLSEVEREDEQDKESSNKITLMTVHASKGLEFPYVYIAGMEENLFPSGSKNGKPDDIEEERRLFYVALTRAKKCVTVSYSKNRMKWGQRESNHVSRFLCEIDKQYLNGSLDMNDDVEIPSFLSRRNDYNTTQSRTASNTPQERRSYTTQPAFPRSSVTHQPNPNFIADPIFKLEVGQQVEHDRFGFGAIISFEGDDLNKKAVVDFKNGGKKTLLLKFAKLRIVK